MYICMRSALCSNRRNFRQVEREEIQLSREGWLASWAGVRLIDSEIKSRDFVIGKWKLDLRSGAIENPFWHPAGQRMKETSYEQKIFKMLPSKRPSRDLGCPLPCSFASPPDPISRPKIHRRFSIRRIRLLFGLSTQPFGQV